MNLPLQIYDFVSVLLPGIIALLIVKIEYANWIIWNLESLNLHLALLFALSYVCGQLLQSASRVYWRLLGYVKKIINTKLFTDSHILENQEISLIRGRHYDIPFSSILANELDTIFKEYYNLNLSDLKREEAFGLVYSPVHDRMGQRAVFVALANLNRCLACLLTLYLFFLIGKLFYFLLNPMLEIFWLQTICLFILIISSLCLSILNVSFFKKMTDQIPYLAFLSWYKEKKLSNTPGK